MVSIILEIAQLCLKLDTLMEAQILLTGMTAFQILSVLYGFIAQPMDKPDMA
jgi:hypothetical protein